MSDNSLVINNSLLFGQEARRVRRAREISLIRLIDTLDVSRSTVLRFEKGQHDIRLSQLVELADLYGMDVVMRPKKS